jgi:hypothetical protein
MMASAVSPPGILDRDITRIHKVLFERRYPRL